MASNLRALPLPEHVSLVTTHKRGDALDGTVRQVPTGTLMLIELGKLHQDPDNIRKNIGDVTELAASMQKQGMLQAMTVAPHPTKAGHYYIKAGNRRRAAAELAGLREAPCIIRQNLIGIVPTIKAMLSENWDREDVSAIEKAEALGRLHFEQGVTVKQIARDLGKSVGAIYYYLDLLSLSDATKALVESKQLSVADATQAIRRERARIAKANGSPDRRKVVAMTWEPDHLDRTHPLAHKASVLCDARNHNNRRRLGKGKVACGACFETVIREDERLVVMTRLAAEQGQVEWCGKQEAVPHSR